ncbi:MAG TPA: hypothetical protein DEA96_11390 [Leptospiraceae bacterium]|nr:hypothetical protein [Spirochaetaceae bacterium]HBS05563.1 hypothetical protein [Leptospiraceae bacterium]|tara:strand:- start:172 stop:585 length:414 start_codon:yes stop_codon:yes gene_type:complete
MEFIAALIVTSSILGAGFLLGYNRDRSYYTTILIVIALIYVLFGFMEGTAQRILVESVIALIFIAAAILGERLSHMITGVFIILHGIFDVMHPQLLPGKVVPEWYPLFCLYVDLMLGFAVIILNARGYLPRRKESSE